METTDLSIVISRIQDKDPEIQHEALKTLHQFIAKTQSTIGFKQQDLYDRLDELTKIVENLKENNKKYLYDLLSVMNLFHSDKNVLRFRLLGCYTDISEWGLQYVRKLVCCILDVINQKLDMEDYTPLVVPIIDFLFKNNAEVEAIDFIFEVSFVPLKNDQGEEKNKMFTADYTDMIFKYIDNDNKDRITLYIEEMDKFYNIEELILKLYHNNPSKFLVYLLKINKKAAAIEFVQSIQDPLVQKQCLYILARNNIFYECNEETRSILLNSFLSENFFNVASSLELLPPQKLEHIFKSLDKAEAAAIANALVHFAYCRDPIFFPSQDDYKIKQEIADHLKTHKSISVTASIGLIHSYSHERVIQCYSNILYEKPDVGAALALAIASQRHHDSDSENLNLLSNFLSSEKKSETLAAMLGISILYSATASQKAYDAIFPFLSSPEPDIVMFAIYVLGSIFACTCDEEIASSCLAVYNEIKNDSPFCNLSILGISLIVMKCPQAEKMPFFAKFDNYTKILSFGLMYVGSGNSKVVDDILTEAFTGDTDALLESLGLISCCLIGIGDNIAMSLIDRICKSSLLLDSPHLKSIFPLCLALLYPSNPKSETIDALEKSLSNGESDPNSLIALGIVGAGTRSSRIIRILDTNYGNVYKDPRAASSLILSQGLVNLGKGLFTLSPLFYENKIVADKPLIGLISTVFLFLDQTIFPEFSYFCYLLSSSITPKYTTGYLGTCKVGKPVDVVGLAGKPNKLSGVVVHTLPIVLNTNEKAEVDDEVLTSYIEDVLVKKN
ncbi:proteasome regulatory particle base subunit [Glugoides intestinalis]